MKIEEAAQTHAIILQFLCIMYPLKILNINMTKSSRKK